MPGVDVAHDTAPGVEAAVEQRDQRVGGAEIGVEGRGGRRDRGARVRLGRRGPQGRPRGGHEDGGPDALAHDVGEGEPDGAGLGVPVVEVAAHRTCRPAARRELVAGGVRWRTGQEGLLDLRGAVQLLGPGELVLRPGRELGEQGAVGVGEGARAFVEQAQRAHGLVPGCLDGVSGVEAQVRITGDHRVPGEPVVGAEVLQHVRVGLGDGGVARRVGPRRGVGLEAGPREEPLRVAVEHGHRRHRHAEQPSREPRQAVETLGPLRRRAHEDVLGRADPALLPVGVDRLCHDSLPPDCACC
ncbi:hypothetical protein PHK61_18820 [Actinomycetospora lutea]|nr:hypothetical protein [Actinomycetospora lutea]MDD7940481.1 hypothetical protein [Actinomycetospora lutea]